MLTKYFRFVVATVLAVVLQASAWAGEEEHIPIAKLPEAVTKAVKARYPNGELLSAEVKYEVKVKSGGKEYKVKATHEGKILEVDGKKIH